MVSNSGGVIMIAMHRIDMMCGVSEVSDVLRLSAVYELTLY